MTGSLLLRGVDLAAFAVALVDRLRSVGVTVPPVGSAALVQAMRVLAPSERGQLYWAARLTLVSNADDLPAFDSVFDAVFAHAVLGLDPPGLKRQHINPVEPARASSSVNSSTAEGEGLPWTTRPASLIAFDEPSAGTLLPDLLPSRLAVRADEPFDRFDAEDLRRIGVWLERSQTYWPRRRTLRRESHRTGRRIDLRQTLRKSRTTGWEPIRLTRTRLRSRPRRVVLLCDVSGSMQPYASVYLHLMRAAALRRKGIRPELFAFATSLTRLTPALSHRSAELALARANEKVVDRYGGTHIGRSIAEILNAQHGNALRGAVVVIASDGWDADPPAVLSHAMARLRRRAAIVVWVNPRAARPGFEPLAGAMAAALPFCDQLLAAHSVNGLRELLDAMRRA
jgi:uncharacterized protein with von Willebrand factor type A (vWA) domain